MSWSGLLKVLSGLLLAVALIVSGGYVTAQYLIAQFTAPPPRPTFPNDKPSPKSKLSTPKPKPAAAIAPAPKPSPSPSPTPTKSVDYRARIVLENGLNVREAPDRDSARVGGVDYNEEVIVLEDSSDQEWQKVRVEGSNVEGWIKSGYTERVN